jgi:hypothetical protein
MEVIYDPWKSVAYLAKIAEDGIARMRLVQRVPVQPVLDSDNAGAEERLENHGHGRLAAVHAGIEEADGRGDLPAEACRDEQPAQIALFGVISRSY